MIIQVLFFGATADIAGTRRIHIDVSPQTLAKAVFEKILSKHPRLASHKLHISINQQYATGDEVVRDGDEIAIFTVVSGG